VSGFEILRYVELIAVIAAAGAVIALALRWYALADRLHRLADQVSTVVDTDVKRALQQVEETARGVQDTAAKIDGTLTPFATTVHRIEHWTAALAAEGLVASTVSPALHRVGGWLLGLRRGVAEVAKHRGP
jgi:hypothetical protein